VLREALTTMQTRTFALLHAGVYGQQFVRSPGFQRALMDQVSALTFSSNSMTSCAMWNSPCRAVLHLLTIRTASASHVNIG